MKNWDRSRILFWISCTFLFALTNFAYGVIVQRYKVFPFSLISATKEAFEQLQDTFGVAPQQLVHAARHQGRGVTRFDKVRTSPGITLIAGFLDGGNELRLIRADGSVVNRWLVPLSRISPDLSHVRPADKIPQGDMNVELNGALALPDGSVVFNYEDATTVKLDRCGSAEWTLPRATHHSVERAEDGSFWIPSARYVESEPQFPELKVPYLDDTILKVSENGEVLLELSILDILSQNNLRPLLLANRSVPLFRNGSEFTHLNDVEQLRSDMAAAFPKFAIGDLLVSLRYQHLIMVIDPVTQKIKWHQIGPWIGQHDPDFEFNGRISVLNNNSDGTRTGSLLGGSNILEVDPVNGAVSVKYDGAAQHNRWFTVVQGRHQILENGNILITESHAGRVFEVTASGDLVWEFINRYHQDQIGVVTGAIRYPENYFAVKDWSCS